MSEWCLAHPWMTFFILMALICESTAMVRMILNRNQSQPKVEEVVDAPNT